MDGDDTPNEKPEGDVRLEDGDMPDDGDTAEDGGRLEDDSTLEESHFTSKQIEPFPLWYENGYDLCTNTDYAAWLIMTHPEGVSDGILSEYNSTRESARSDPFQPYEMTSVMTVPMFWTATRLSPLNHWTL